jgi:hypothetical protein
MSDILTSIGSFLTTDLKPLQSVLALAGAGTNIFSGIQQEQQQSRINNAQNYVNSLVTNPQKMAAASAAYTQPLTAGLTSDISNEVQGNLAERGLGSSPGAYTQQLTAALAPYILQQQQGGQNALFQALGLASNERSTAPGFANIAQLLASLKSGSQSTATPAIVAPTSSSTNYPYDDTASLTIPFLPED